MSCAQPTPVEFSSAPLSIERAAESDAAAWDNFVDAHPEGRFCHLWGYRAALAHYRLPCEYLKVLHGSELVGIFPAVIARGHMVSQPYNEYGGPLLRSVAPDQLVDVAGLFLDFAQQHGCESVEIRGGLGSEWLANAACCTPHLLQSYGEVKVSTQEELWKHALDHRARSSIKQAWNSGLVSRVVIGPEAIGGEFYELYLRSMKRLAVPPHSKRFFRALAEGLGNRLVASWVMDGNRSAAVLVGGLASRRVHCIIIASDERSWKKRPNDLAGWQMMQWASEQSLKAVDFGSASTSDELRFKKKFGAELKPYWKYILHRKPEHSSSRREWHLSKSLWQWMPLPLTQWVGPVLRRYLT